MAVSTFIPRSRRAVLAGALGAAAASLAATLGRPRSVAAADDEAMLVGGEYTSTSVTKITNTTNGATVIEGSSTTGVGVRGQSSGNYGVAGISSSFVGTYGHSESSWGVYGTSTSSIGLSGRSYGVDMPATVGQAYGHSTGVLGYSGTGGLSAAPAKTGVYGYAAQDADARGVWGRSTAGRGVYGQSSSGQGVRGFSSTGVALYGSTSDPKKGAGLRVVGKVRLDHCAGVATVIAATNSTTVTPGVDLTSTSAVTATLMGSAGGTTTVHRVALDTATDQFTIVLTANAASNVKVAWHVFG
jgi:hypothetical protein